MNLSKSGIPSEAMKLAEQGHIVEAIKIVREQAGLGLKEAKEAVDAYLRNPDGATYPDKSNQSHHSSDIPGLAIAALEKGQLLEAIKHTRAVTGLGLKDAKETVERYLEEHPGINGKFKSTASAEFSRVVRNMIFVLFLLGLVALGYQQFFGINP